MNLYTAKILLAGSPDNEVIEHNLTPAEIAVLQHIHAGNRPPVVNIVHTATTNRSDARERARLAEKYTKGELTSDRGARLINSLFGVGGALPQEYVEPKIEAIETVVPIEESDEEIVPVAAARVPFKRKDDAASAVA